MKKGFLYFSLCVLFTFVSCSDDDTPTQPLPDVAIENQNGSFQVAQDDTVRLKAKIASATEFKWLVDGEKISSDSVFKFVPKEVKDYTITLVAINAGGESLSRVNLQVYGKFRDGVFVLNEGNMTSENGSLVFISPQGTVTDSAYYKVNGTQLGNTAQDLFIANGKIYIISQNGKKNAVGTGFDNDGMLIVANAETLKKVSTYNDELSTLSWPSHVAVTGSDNVFIRDNKGVYLFNTSAKQLKLIKGTSGASKNRMAVIGDKVFSPSSKTVLVMQADKDSIVKKIEFTSTVTGVQKSSDGNLWVSCSGSPSKIIKVNPSTYATIKENSVTEISIGAGWGATPAFSAKGDTLYFSNASTKIYRHVFASGKTDFMVDAKTMVEDAGIVYNNLAVHPVSGEVYLNTIKGYGLNYLVNNISVFSLSGATPKLSVNYKNHTKFPAGIFFTDSFK